MMKGGITMKKMPMGGNFNMNNLMKQAQKIQQDMAKKQAELEEMEFTASSGGGAVTATVKQKQLIKIGRASCRERVFITV